MPRLFHLRSQDSTLIAKFSVPANRKGLPETSPLNTLSLSEWRKRVKLKMIEFGWSDLTPCYAVEVSPQDF